MTSLISVSTPRLVICHHCIPWRWGAVTTLSGDISKTAFVGRGGLRSQLLTHI